ncbi:Na(+)/H(+) antiporter subunit F1 [Paenibacillus senegalensis]|uniref:Na(+)/H(+) antiporter subunit F1 n=1 Tax=Paenibacillus senegalensis TaxID=1465766 RepID=UPI0002897A65|nr:Na(+)/H(+) antiporter subunit F1 [Paenibacillus senegalensis]
MLEGMLTAAAIILSLSILTCMYRVIKGPSMPDRIIALDTIGINMIALVAVLCVHMKTQAFLELILVVGILAFLGTIAFAKYIEKGVVLEHDRDHPDDR